MGFLSQQLDGASAAARPPPQRYGGSGGVKGATHSAAGSKAEADSGSQAAQNKPAELSSPPRHIWPQWRERPTVSAAPPAPDVVGILHIILLTAAAALLQPALVQSFQGLVETLSSSAGSCPGFIHLLFKSHTHPPELWR